MLKHIYFFFRKNHAQVSLFYLPFATLIGDSVVVVALAVKLTKSPNSSFA